MKPSFTLPFLAGFLAAFLAARLLPSGTADDCLQAGGAQIKVPAGFSVEEYAGGFARPRFMVEGPGGEVIASETIPNGSVMAVRAGAKKTLVSGLDRPYGVGALEGVSLRCGTEPL